MKIDLQGGDTPSRSKIASAQRRLNMYVELTDPKTGEPGKVTHYPTPGLRPLAVTPNGQPLRGLYRASNGDLYGAADQDIYFIDASWVFHLVGTMTPSVLPPVILPIKMADNGTSLIIANGMMRDGWSVDMKTRNGLTPLYNPTASDQLTTTSDGWLGSTWVDFSDGFLFGNFIDTPTFYISNPQDVIFDSLQFASKASYPDPVVAALIQHRVLWVIGKLSSEVWYNTGGGSTLGNTFPYEIMPGSAIDWGCAAPYSLAKAETALFWLAQNLTGELVVLRGSGYNVARISTHSLEHVLAGYDDVSDCIAYTYLQEGHSFYVMNFPSADATWVYDLAAGEWHERCFTDVNGEEHMQVATMHAFAYNQNVVNDWRSGNLYALDLETYTDAGTPIKREIGFPRQIDTDDDHRVVFKNFVAEMDFGESLVPSDDNLIELSWSDDKGHTFGNALQQSLGKVGAYGTFVKFNRLGMSRNRVFRLKWTVNGFSALQGAYVDVIKAGA